MTDSSLCIITSIIKSSLHLSAAAPSMVVSQPSTLYNIFAAQHVCRFLRRKGSANSSRSPLIECIRSLSIPSTWALLSLTSWAVPSCLIPLYTSTWHETTQGGHLLQQLSLHNPAFLNPTLQTDRWAAFRSQPEKRLKALFLSFILSPLNRLVVFLGSSLKTDQIKIRGFLLILFLLLCKFSIAKQPIAAIPCIISRLSMSDKSGRRWRTQGELTSLQASKQVLKMHGNANKARIRKQWLRLYWYKRL